MNRKLTRRFLSAVLTLALSIALLGTSSLASGNVNEVKEKTGSDGRIVVTVYDQNPGSQGTGELNTSLSSGDPVEGVSINAQRIGSVVELTSTDKDGNVSTQVAFGLDDTICGLLQLNSSDAIATQNNVHYFTPNSVQDALKNVLQDKQDAIEGYLTTDSSNKTTKTTDAQGVANFEKLSHGLYLLAKSSLPADATTDLVPFLVSVPMYVESDAGDTWNSTVYAYPKVRTAEITIAKSVNDDDNYVNAGQTLKYTVTATIPDSNTADGTGSANEFTQFKITDTNTDSTLKIDADSVSVKLGTTTLTKDTQYTQEYKNGDLTITLTETQTTGGLAELNKNLDKQQTLTVTYDAAVNTGVAFSTSLTNTAKATYRRDGMTAVADIGSNTVNLYTYGLDLTKTLSNEKSISADTISFELYKTYDGKTLSDPVPVKNVNSKYWQDEESGNGIKKMYVDTNGKLNLYGLEPGTYYLKETATMAGYTLLAEPITIVITADDQQGGVPAMTATVNGVDAQVTDGLVYLSVENTENQSGFTLPLTGGAGTMAVTAAGLGLLCAGIILFAVYRRKGQKNA